MNYLTVLFVCPTIVAYVPDGKCEDTNTTTDVRIVELTSIAENCSRVVSAKIDSFHKDIDAKLEGVSSKCGTCSCSTDDHKGDATSCLENVEKVAFGLTRTEWISMSIQSVNLGFTITMFGVMLHLMIRC
ncbi:14.1 kDa [Spodoptera frugiperda ascovirus 1a]|uniref:14.1 kDa n=1 Tax=Spodoptera frugiperda ascovirus 1a TaxID=113370 RepID=Q0E516_SFAVA|nr:14.1 kDa [Spodoptera frugiperda ascovirus 1a]CAL44685.1 14.1 kDa [Spodoptera frugiperda ascovirus 1a]